jgi:hypothetical protein
MYDLGNAKVGHVAIHRVGYRVGAEAHTING